MVGCFLLSSCPMSISEFKKKEWSMVKEIYRERYTSVYMCIYLDTNHTGALKLYSKKDLGHKRIKHIESEIKIHKLLDGQKYIVPLWFYFESSSYYALMTKYMNQETLLSFIYKYTNEYCILKEVIYPLLKILNNIHNHKIIHRDLKPENIFVHNKKIHIGDFGYSCILETETPESSVIGTIQYMAPELLISYIDKTKKIEYKYEIDVWSLGIIAYELIFHKKPFGWSSYKNLCEQDPTNPEFISKCLNAPLEFPKDVSIDAKDFLIKCLNKDQKLRSPIKELLEHPWILNYLNNKTVFNEICPLQYDLTYQTKNRQPALSMILEKKATSKNHCSIC